MMGQVEQFTRKLMSGRGSSRPVGRKIHPYFAWPTDMCGAQIMAAVMLVCVCFFFAASITPPARGDIGGEVGVSEGVGFDSCGLPTLPDARYLYNHVDSHGARFAYLGLYVGGAIAFPPGGGNCNTYFKAGVNKLHHTGYDFLPLMDGRQPPCSIESELFFRDDEAGNFQHAREAGEQEAETAVKRMGERGFTAPGSIVYYDLESFDASDRTCLAATKVFVSSWDRTLQNKFGVSSGLYGPTGGASLREFWNIPFNPDDLWFSEVYVLKKEVPDAHERRDINEEYESVWNPRKALLPEELWPERRLHQWEKDEPFKQLHSPYHVYHFDLSCAMGLVVGSGEKKATSACQAK